MSASTRTSSAPFPFAAPLLLLATLAACSRNPFASAQDYVRRGNEFHQQEKYDDALIQYRKALQKEPLSGEAYYRSGLTLTRLEKTDEALSALTKAAELMPKNMEVQKELGQLALYAFLPNPRRPQALYQTINKAAETLLTENPASFEGLRLRGYVALADSKTKEAIEFFRKASAAKPDQGEIVTILVQSLLRDNQQAEAERLARDSLSRIREFGPLYDSLYALYMQTSRPAEAEQVLKTKIANNPGKSFFVIQLAQHYRRQRRASEADGLITDLLSQVAAHPDILLLVGDYYRDSGQPEKAIEVYRRGLTADKDRRSEYQDRLIFVQIDSGRIEDAETALDSILRAKPGDTKALSARALLRLRTSKPDDIRKSIEDLMAVARKEPENLENHFHLARAHRTLGQAAEARTALREILRRDSYHKAALKESASLAIENQQADEAMEFAERYLAQTPHDPAVLLNRTAAWALRGRFSEVRLELRRLAAEFPNLPEVKMQMGLLELQDRNYVQAERIFRQLYRPVQGEFLALKGLVEVYTAQNQPGKAVSLLLEEQKRYPNQAVIETLLVSAAERSGNLDLALATATKLAAAFPDHPQYYTDLGRLQHSKGLLREAIATLQKAQQLSPTSASPPMILGAVLADAGRSQEAIAAYRRCLQLQEGNPYAANNLAWLLTETGGSLAEASRLVQAALQNDPENPAYVDTAGMIHLKARRLDSALQIFQGLVRKNPGNATYRIHLARTHIEMGERPKARAELGLALSGQPSVTEKAEIRRLAGSIP